jgi:alginate export protein
MQMTPGRNPPVRALVIAALLWFCQPLLDLPVLAQVASGSATPLEASSIAGSGANLTNPNGWLPQSLGLGSLGLGSLALRPTLGIQLDGFGEGNNGWGGHFTPPIQQSRFFFENSITPGLNADFALGQFGKLAGRASAIYDMTGGGLNAAGTNYGDLQARDFSVEDGYLKWTSGPLFALLGNDAIELIFGRYTYQIGDGFLFCNGASGGGNRVSAWLAPHRAFRESAIATLNSHGALLEGFYLSPNDHPSTNTELAGVNAELHRFELVQLGLTYANIVHSETPSRQGLNVVYVRAEGAVLPRFKDFYLAASFAAESNGRRVSRAFGWYVTPSYTFSHLRGQPTLYYRYASFSGGGPEDSHNFDPLFYGMSDWGTWYQGEILGNWIATNSNLNSHQVRLSIAAADDITMNLIYYHFTLASRAQNLVPGLAAVKSNNLADEVNLIVDVSLTNWWTISLMCAVDVPGPAARQISGGAQTWIQPAIWSGWSF